MTRLDRQLTFSREIEALKTVYRRNVVYDQSRQENSAEHSWHVAMLVLLLGEHSAEPVDVLHALKIALVHDIVEVDAGDTCAHDETARETQAEREEQAAERLFGLLPDDMGSEFYALWRDYELSESAEARLVRSLDRVQPVMLHRLTEGTAWKRNGIRVDQVRRRVAEVEQTLPALWPSLVNSLDKAHASGQLRDELPED